jgi:hypothetical protein
LEISVRTGHVHRSRDDETDEPEPFVHWHVSVVPLTAQSLHEVE